MTFEETIATLKGTGNAGASTTTPNKRDRFAVEAIAAICQGFNDPRKAALLIEIANGISELAHAVERLQHHGAEAEVRRRILQHFQQFLLERIPAAYALRSTYSEREDVLEAYTSDCLRMPLTVDSNTGFKSTIPDAPKGSPGERERWQTIHFVWEALHERRWIRQPKPEAYVRQVTDNLIIHRRKQENKEQVEAWHNGSVLEPVEDINQVNELVGDEGESFEELGGVEDLYPARTYKPDLSSLPPRLRVSIEMVLQGATHAEAIEASGLGCDEEHLSEKCQRVAMAHFNSEFYLSRLTWEERDRRAALSDSEQLAIVRQTIYELAVGPHRTELLGVQHRMVGHKMPVPKKTEVLRQLRAARRDDSVHESFKSWKVIYPLEKRSAFYPH